MVTAPRVTRDHPYRVTTPPPRGAEHARMTSYEISVKGHVSEALLADLAELEAHEAHERPPMTVLLGDVDDAAGLRRLLDRLADRGLELVEVRQVDRGG
jgi:hypothetical protein